MRRIRGKDRQKVTDKTNHGENNYVQRGDMSRNRQTIERKEDRDRKCYRK
jgi:hypothetical protein